MKLHDGHIRLNDDSTFELRDGGKFRSMSRVVAPKENSVANGVPRAGGPPERHEEEMGIVSTLDYDVETQVRDRI